MSDSLHVAPAEQYKQLKTGISNLLDSASQDTAPAPQPARPAQAMSAPPVFHQSQQQVPLYQQQQQQQPPQYQQQQAPQYQQQPFQQYQHQGPKYQQYEQQQQPSQYQQPQQSQSHTSSAASGEQRLSASSFTNLLQTSQEVLDGSLNLSAYSVDSQLVPGSSFNIPSTQSLNTPPAPQLEEVDSDSD